MGRNAELDGIAEKVRESLPPQLRGFEVTTALGATKKEASASFCWVLFVGVVIAAEINGMPVAVVIVADRIIVIELVHRAPFPIVISVWKS